MSGPLNNRLAAARNGAGDSGAPVTPCSPADCDRLWAQVNAEKNRTVAISDPMERNRKITAQYAQLYKAKPELSWVGLAGIVSRQAGCAMVKAKTASDSINPWKSGPADSAYRALGDANKEIYSSIYPATKFYQANGLNRLKQCNRTADGQRRVSPKLMSAFEQIDNGSPKSIRAGSDVIAGYEQRDIIQDRVYSVEEYKDAFEKNEWWSKRPLGRWMGAEAPEIPISTDCTDANKVPFSGSIGSPDSRVAYYNELMNRYEKLPQGVRDGMADRLIRQGR